MKKEKVAGLCLRELNRCAVKEVAHYFFLSMMAQVVRQTVMLMQGLRN